jgi:hypothetical protein
LFFGSINRTFKNGIYQNAYRVFDPFSNLYNLEIIMILSSRIKQIKKSNFLLIKIGLSFKIDKTKKSHGNDEK